jgi:peptidoglycan/LPS O-acetylase OafA/YrhL
MATSAKAIGEGMETGMVGVLERQASPVAQRRERIDAPTVGTADRLLGLDGIRGLAVVAVVLFHLWPRIAPAGFIGVSVFFTLSGFVITRGLLAENERTGSISLRSFWGRRVRRLWPAATTTLAAVVLVWFVTGWGTRAIGRDIVSSFLQVANWRYLVSNDAYGSGETPVSHFWSLAIEEQLYVVVPVVVWALRRRLDVLAAVLSLLVAGSVLATASANGDANVVYYSTFTRSAELLAGALLAVASMHLPVVAPSRSRQLVAGVAGTAALAVLGWSILAASLSTAFLYEGGLTLVAVPSVVALAGAIWSPGLVRVLSVRPLRWLGAVSYGIYLIHWPLHVAFANTGFPRVLQPWIVLGLTLLLAPLSFRFIEEPVRRRQMPRVVLRPAIAVLSVVVLGGGLAVANAPSKAREIDFAAAISQLRTSEKVAAAAFPSGRPVVGEAVAPPSSVAPEVLIGTPQWPLRVGVFGDSTGLMLGLGIEQLADPSVRVVGSSVDLGCPLGRTGLVRGDSRLGNDPTTPSFEPHATCDWGNWVTAAQAAGGFDIAVLLLGNWDIAGRRVPALGDRWLTAGDPDYDAWLAREMAAASDAVHAAGVQRLVWLELPPDVGAASNARIDRFNQLVRSNAASRPWISVVDYPAFLRSIGREAEMRPDNVHLTRESAAEVARDWLNPLLVESARRRA